MEGNQRIRTDGRDANANADADARPVAQTMQDPHHTNLEPYDE